MGTACTSPNRAPDLRSESSKWRKPISTVECLLPALIVGLLKNAISAEVAPGSCWGQMYAYMYALLLHTLGNFTAMQPESY
jgi:hypothetical protein